MIPNRTSAFAAAVLLIGAGLAAAEPIVIDPAGPGRVFEGLGALSAGASSRLLLDYPEPARSAVLDLLFKPNWGAALHHLKLEIGGDVNSTDGTEPSFARTREEFENPRRDYFDRGYEWWLMREAKKRNPAIFIDVLQWGAPGWIGDRDLPELPGLTTRPWGEEVQKYNRAKFYTRDNAEFIAAFLNGARRYHGVDVDFCGIWNETHWDNDWIKLLRQTLDGHDLKRVRIVAADQCGRRPWEIAKDMLKDATLTEAIYAIGAHYAGMMRKDEQGDDQYDAIPEAKQTGKPLWASEDGPWRGDWQGAGVLARMFNRNYIRGQMTKTVIWSLVTSYYNNLPLPGSGPMLANTPWSGHFEVQPALWAIAHTTQFAQPGWRYLDSASAITDDELSYVTLISPDGKQFSIIIESIGATRPTTLTFRTGGDLRAGTLHVWRSTKDVQFEQLADLPAIDAGFSLTVEPGCIYSLTTTTGQHKANVDVPPATPFPLPYADDFDEAPVGKYAKYFSDQGGVFEVADSEAPRRHVLRQTLDRKGIDWNFHPTPEPYTVLGSPGWRSYELSCDAQLEQAGYVAILGRVGKCPQSQNPPEAYWLKMTDRGEWELKAGVKTLASGTTSFETGQWHSLKLRFTGPDIAGFIDDRQVITHRDLTFGGGMVGLGTGWNTARFDRFSVRPLPGGE